MLSNEILVPITLCSFIFTLTHTLTPNVETNEITEGSYFKSVFERAKAKLSNVEWSEYKRKLKNVQDEMKSEYFSYDFVCAIDDIIFNLDYKVKAYEEKFNSPLARHTIFHHKYLEIPDEFVYINRTRDLWIYYSDEPVTPVAISESVDELTLHFRRWYYLLTMPTMRNDLRHPTIVRLRSRLDRHFYLNPDRYKSKDHVYERFAAHMSRSFLMARELRRSVISELISYLHTHEHISFDEALLDTLGTWYFTEEQLIFLNYLRQIQYEGTRTIDEIKGYMVRNAYVRNDTQGDVVLIPYLRLTRRAKPVDLYQTLSFSSIIPTLKKDLLTFVET